MKNLLDQTLTTYTHCIRSSAAQRTFEQCFPRLTIKNSVGAGWEEGEKVSLEAPVCVVSIISASTDQNDRTRIPFLGGHSKKPHQHQQRPLWLSWHIIKPVFQTQITTLRSSSPSLSPLIKLTPPSTNAYRFCSKFLHRIRAPYASSPLIHSPEIVTPLCAILPTIASAHPDPAVRQQTFRTISSLLTLTH